jgi:hypothetical protein
MFTVLAVEFIPQTFITVQQLTAATEARPY